MAKRKHSTKKGAARTKSAHPVRRRPQSTRRPKKTSAAKRSSPSKTESGPPRLQKVLAAAGRGSRRECEELILEGRVEIDRQVVVELGTRVDPDSQEVRVDGEVLRAPERLYYAVYKPTGVISTNRDPDGRMRVIDLIGSQHRLFTIGRLDKTSEGLILVTNDGELANRMTHPRYGVEKTYHVLVQGTPNNNHLRMLTEGVRLAEGVAKAKHARIKKRQKHVCELEIVLDEGRNREIRRLLARIGHKVLRLKRVAIGPLKLGLMSPGEFRQLRPDEVNKLRRLGDQGGAPSGKPAKSRPANQRGNAGRPVAKKKKMRRK